MSVIAWESTLQDQWLVFRQTVSCGLFYAPCFWALPLSLHGYISGCHCPYFKLYVRFAMSSSWFQSKAEDRIGLETNDTTVMCGYTVLRPQRVVGNAPRMVSLSVVPTTILCSPLTTIFGVWQRGLTRVKGLGHDTTVRNTRYALDTVVPAVRADLSLVALVQYFVKRVNVTERWDMLPVFSSGQEQVSWLEHGFGLKHYEILNLLNLCWYFLIAADILYVWPHVGRMGVADMT